MEVSLWIWGIFIAAIIIMLIADLKLVMRKPHRIGTREAVIYSAVWIGAGVAFTGVMAWWQGGTAAMEYITGYVIEKSLSLDNVFLWAVLFTYFRVPGKYQHKVLFWGIFGALVLRAAFIFGGVALLNHFHRVIYVFGAILLYTATKLFTSGEVAEDPENNKILKLVNRYLPQTKTYREGAFFVIENGKRLATPLFTVLIIIELSDILFAVDSIPAILSITKKQFIVFSSNAMAILGLRALYFLLADMKNRFTYLNKGLAVILAFVGVKFIISNWLEIPIWLSLTFIAVVITGAILLSIRKR